MPYARSLRARELSRAFAHRGDMFDFHRLFLDFFEFFTDCITTADFAATTHCET